MVVGKTCLAALAMLAVCQGVGGTSADAASGGSRFCATSKDAADGTKPIPPEIARASSFGFDPDDATDCLQAAINSGVPTLVVDNVGAPWIVRPLRAVSNQRIVFEPGVVLLAKAGEYQRINDCLMLVAGQTNVVFSGYGAVFRMRRADYCAAPYKFAEWRHALSIRGSSHITVEGLRFEESGGDGIYIDQLQRRNLKAVGITIRDVVCDRNLRQGMSVIGVEDLLVENCVFSNTKGAPPEAGIDFEPNNPEEPFINCVLRNCTMVNNNGEGVAIVAARSDLSTPPMSIRFENCVVSGNRRGFYYHDGRIPRDALFACDGGDVEMVGCTIQSNRANAVFARHKPLSGARMSFRNCRFEDNCTVSNTLADVDVAVTGHGMSPANSFTFENVAIIQNSRRPWVSTTGDGQTLNGNPTRFLGSVDIVGPDGEGRREVLGEEWMKGRFDWVPSDEPPVPPRVAPRLDAVQVVDTAPGELLPLPEVVVRNGRFFAAYAFFADRSGTVRFRTRLWPGKTGETIPQQIDVFSYKSGEKVATALVPSDGEETAVELDVPARGFYRFNAPGNYASFTVTASSVPLALDLAKGQCPFIKCEKTLWFHVDGDRPFAFWANGDGQEGLAAELVDSSGNAVWSRSVAGDQGDVFVSDPAPMRGLWRAEIRRADGIFFEDHSVGLSGIDAFLFLSGNRYWCIK